jgi:signal recognition particle subunit SRP68
LIYNALAADFLSNRHVYLYLLASERAWAHAMSMKASHATDQKGIVGRTRSHILSRLRKAAENADHLVTALSSDESSGASTTDILEAKAYAAMIRGAKLFEKQSWEACLKDYSIARIIYSALATAANADIFKDLLSETIDPSIRYAAYQLKTPRTIPIPNIALKAFPRDEEELVSQVNKIDPTVLSEKSADSDKQGLGVGSTPPQTLTWRSREVKIEDAQIATAWQAVQVAKKQLADKLSNLDHSHPYVVAGAYDGILTATQDAVDATKTAIDELRAEGVSQSDPRMQSLQITRTAVNFEMISWRIGRNRVLTGSHDGVTEEYDVGRRRKAAKSPNTEDAQGRDLPASKKLAKLKEKSALYDGTLQNLQSIKELPGVAADEGLATKLEAFVHYFQALT